MDINLAKSRARVGSVSKRNKKNTHPFYVLLYCHVQGIFFPLQFKHILYKRNTLGFPGGAVVENLPANAGDTGSSPGKIPHAAEQLGPWATTTEPARLQPVLRNKRGRDSETTTHCDEEWPPLATTRESPRTETKTQRNQK